MSLWVYPILNELSFWYRGLFLLGSTLFNIGLYFIGEMLTLALTSNVHSLRKDFSHYPCLGSTTNDLDGRKKKA